MRNFYDPIGVDFTSFCLKLVDPLDLELMDTVPFVGAIYRPDIVLLNADFGGDRDGMIWEELREVANEIHLDVVVCVLDRVDDLVDPFVRVALVDPVADDSFLKVVCWFV